MSQSPVSVGDVLADKYRVEEVIGVGGMGVVVGARHIELDTHVALKFMLPEHLDNEEAVARFLREGKAAARLRGEHVARVTDVGKLASGAPYMVMEYLEGFDLGALAKKEIRPTMAEACLYIFQACDALDEAHAAGIVHRDIKPSNLFLTKTPKGEPCVKVVDFGISKLQPSGDAASNMHVTRTAAVFGSPLYMSPEQMRSSRDVDARADVWSLGATLYELLTGAVPFTGESVIDLAMRITQDPVAPPSSVAPSIPKELDAIVVKCLEKEPKDRFQTVRELGDVLAPFAGERASAPPKTIVTVARDATRARNEPVSPAGATDPGWGRTNPPKKAASRVWMFGVGGAVLVAVIAGVAVTSSHREGAAASASSAPPTTTTTSDTATATVTATANTTTTATVAATATETSSAPAPSVSVTATATTTTTAKPKPTASAKAATSAKPATTNDPYSNPN
ncbi:MAG TPA: serine/threonine-protein kinase [Polyangiaceae bacterium]|nr:serine/threonine-protein kinase [Polyangiaceae bacterium]